MAWETPEWAKNEQLTPEAEATKKANETALWNTDTDDAMMLAFVEAFEDWEKDAQETQKKIPNATKMAWFLDWKWWVRKDDPDGKKIKMVQK